jgi:hypothetical protein
MMALFVDNIVRRWREWRDRRRGLREGTYTEEIAVLANPRRPQ